MKLRRPLMLLAVLGLGSVCWALAARDEAAVDLSAAANGFLDSLSDEQRAKAALDYDTPKRVGWHFIPMDERKGLQIRDMKPDQRKLAHTLLAGTLSAAGYGKATQIMQLEAILRELEKGKGRNIRDPERYYFTIFGKPAGDGRWGLSVEGHHLSLNFVVERGQIVASTPAFFGANPGIVMGDYGVGPKKGTRVLAQEELLGFKLVNSLTPEQLETALINKKAPSDIRAAGEAQPPTDAPAGLAAARMTDEQTNTLRGLIEEYAIAMPANVAKARITAIDKAGMERVHFAWAGATKPGVGHYYRIQGPTFLIEFCNTQPDSAGNVANHIHSVWRDMSGDFGIPLKAK